MLYYLSLFITVAWQLSVIVPQAGPPEQFLLLFVMDQLHCEEGLHKKTRMFFLLFFFGAIARQISAIVSLAGP